MDKGTIIRTVVLGIALLNQFLVSFGMYEIPGSAEEQTLFITTVFTAASATWAWFKNNYVTAKGKAQKEALKARGLTDAE